jgi:hypothetical protein
MRLRSLTSPGSVAATTAVGRSFLTATKSRSWSPRKGRLLGLRATDGSVIPIPERRIEEVPDEECVWIGGRCGGNGLTEPPVCEA